MTALLGVYLILVAGFLVVMMLKQHDRGEVDLLSIRNVALAGFIIFQLLDGGFALIGGRLTHSYLNNPFRTGLEFCAMSTVFLILALWSYRRGFVVKSMARAVPKPQDAPGNGGLLVLAVVATIASAAFKFGVAIPYVGFISGMIAVGMSAAACAMVGWVLAKRTMNPTLVLFSILIFGMNAAIVVAGAFGRRDLVAIGAGIVWGAYYSAWSGQASRKLIKRVALIAAGPVIVVALFTSVRHSGEQGSTLEVVKKIVSEGDLRSGLGMLASGQGAGSISMWLIERAPEELPYDHLLTIRFYIVYAVPRAWWPDKPEPMSIRFKDVANLRGVASNFNVGPGIIGNAGWEGGWYALVIYGIVAGLFLRFFEQVIIDGRNNPLIVAAGGCALGQVLGLARGEASSFAFIMTVAIGGTYMLLMVAQRLVPRYPLESFDGDNEEWLLDHDSPEPFPAPFPI